MGVIDTFTSHYKLLAGSVFLQPQCPELIHLLLKQMLHTVKDKQITELAFFHLITFQNFGL